MINLTPEQRLDKNNRLVTRHVKTDKNAGTSRRAINKQDIKRKAPPSLLPDKTRTVDWFAVRPTEEDKAEAMKNVIDDLMGYSRRWDVVMGAKTRRTNNNIAVFYERQQEYVESFPDLMDKVKEESYKVSSWKAHVRAFDAGIGTEYDDEFESIWKGESPGSSEKSVKESLARMTSYKNQLDEGSITPSRIVGTGYINPRKVADEYLTKGIAEKQEALRTRGRNLKTNISNAINNSTYES